MDREEMMDRVEQVVLGLVGSALEITSGVVGTDLDIKCSFHLIGSCALKYKKGQLLHKKW